MFLHGNRKKSNSILHCKGQLRYILHFRLITFIAMNLICKKLCFQVKGKKQLYLALRK